MPPFGHSAHPRRTRRRDRSRESTRLRLAAFVARFAEYVAHGGGVARAFTIAEDGDYNEQRWWPQWTSDHFPSYQAFWVSRIVPVIALVSTRTTADPLDRERSSVDRRVGAPRSAVVRCRFKTSFVAYIDNRALWYAFTGAFCHVPGRFSPIHVHFAASYAVKRRNVVEAGGPRSPCDPPPSETSKT